MKTVIKVEGMMCSHCENRVTTVLSAVEGVSSVVVDLPGNTVTVEHTEDVTFDILKNEIEDQGYDVIA
ncbi:MAG: cation transporter [Proteocatella sp.]